jgi:hypothetical protein
MHRTGIFVHCLPIRDSPRSRGFRYGFEIGSTAAGSAMPMARGDGGGEMKKIKPLLRLSREMPARVDCVGLPRRHRVAAPGSTQAKVMVRRDQTQAEVTNG